MNCPCCEREANRVLWRLFPMWLCLRCINVFGFWSFMPQFFQPKDSEVKFVFYDPKRGSYWTVLYYLLRYGTAGLPGERDNG